MFNAIDARSVIDKITITGTSNQGVSYSRLLSQSKIAPFNHDPTAQLLCIDTYVIIGFIANLGVPLRRTFNVGAYRAIPQQLHRRL